MAENNMNVKIENHGVIPKEEEQATPEELYARLIEKIKNYHPSADDLKMIEEEYNKIETINASLDVYLKNAECLFVMGDNDPFKDADWNSFQSDLKSYRSEELIRCYNDAFARNKK